MVPFARRLQALGGWLCETRELWHPQPLKVLPAPWEQAHPDVSAWARGLSPELLEAWEFRPWLAPGAPALIGALHRAATELAALPAHPIRELPWCPEDTRWVQRRKWGQLTRFAGTVVPRLGPATHVLDWCSGKGHLARALARWSGKSVVGVERQPRLVSEGNRLAERRRLPVTLRRGDVLDPAAVLPPVDSGALVALHACGPLTDAALAHAHTGGARLAAVSPCCLHAVGKGPYRPRSEAGRASGLGLVQSDLYLSMGEERVAPPRLKRRRRTELAWRSGVQLLLQQRCGKTGWTPLKSQPSRVWDTSFAAFARSLDGFEGLRIPEDVDWGVYEARGWARSRLARALGVVRGLFRRPLEVWVALDRAQALAERGWRVEVGTFCVADVTPRNVLIVGER